MTFYADEYEPLEVTVDDANTLHVFTLYFGSYSETSRNRHVAWLIENGVTIGYISFITGGSEIPMLADIEIREEYRSKGYSKYLITTVEEFLGEKLYTSGSYTPLGYERLSRTLTNADPTKVVTGPTFRDQNFVADWDQRWRLQF